MAKENTARSYLGVHVGGAIMQLAGAYPTLSRVILEMVQNSLDSGANRVEVRINHKVRSAIVRDNGEGFSVRKFDEEIAVSIGNTLKPKGKMGRFGVGFVSPLGKCKNHVVISCPNSRVREYNEWTFHPDQILKESHLPYIPRRERADIAFAGSTAKMPHGTQRVWWRTEIHMKDYVADKQLSAFTVDSLAHEIMYSYSIAMRKLGATVDIIVVDEKGNEKKTKVTPHKYSGTKLPAEEFHSEETGKVRFEIYRVKPGHKKRRININFGEIDDDFRVSWSQMRQSPWARDLISDDLLNAFSSGLFEGEILAEKIKLHINRTTFEKDDALVGFFIMIHEWFEKSGQKYFDQESQERRKERYQELGRKSMDRIENLCKNSSLSELWQRVKAGFGCGSIGEGHSDPKTGRILGDQDEGALSPSSGKKKPPAENSATKKKQKKKGKKKHKPEERPGHEPFPTLGPKGGRRVVVKSNSLGLHIGFDELENYDKLWVLDTNTGTLTFNTTHPAWVDCDGSNNMLCALIEYVTIQVLTLEGMLDKTFYSHIRLQFDLMVDNYVAYLKAKSPVGRPRKKKA